MDIKRITNKIASKFGMSRKRKSSFLKRQGPTRVNMEMNNLVKAALEALDPDNSDRQACWIYMKTHGKTARSSASMKRRKPF